jgi:hypothetical protein
MKLSGSITVGFLFILSFRTQGQGSQTIRALKNLLDDPRPVAEICHINTYSFFELGHDKLSLLGQKLVRNNNGLYILVQGTGRVYEVKRERDGARIIRIDSTIYTGNNFGSVPFSYRDTLYSLGGYGFWKSNGHVRMYLANKAEWEIVPVNIEIPFQSDYAFHWFWYDPNAGKIFVGYGTRIDQGIRRKEQKEQSTIDSVAQLDLQKMEWTRLGHATGFLKERYGKFENLGSSPWGQLIYTVDHTTQNNLYLVDYTSNKILIADESRSKEFRQLTSPTCLFYFRDSTLYLGQLDRNRLDSMKLSKLDFKPTGETVYNRDTKASSIVNTINSWRTSLLLLTFFVSAGLLLYFYNAGRKSIKGSVTASRIPASNGSIVSLFDEKELPIVKIVLQNSLNGKATAIEELNRLLGVSNKTIEIQKKQRSDVLISINRKYRFAFNSNDLFIKKKRLELDKRSLECYIDYQQAIALKNMWDH